MDNPIHGVNPSNNLDKNHMTMNYGQWNGILTASRFGAISKMKSIVILFVLEILPVICRSLSSHTLATRFNYDFKRLPNIGEVIVWEILEKLEIIWCIPVSKTFQPQIYTSNIPRLESDKTYLLLTQSQPRRIRIHYWVGSAAPLVAKKLAAKYALEQYLWLTHHYSHKVDVLLFREEEFIESRSFENIVKFKHEILQDIVDRSPYRYLEEQLPYKLPNLYIVKGESTTRIKAVPMGTYWFNNNACLVLETGYYVEELTVATRFCGSTTKVITRSAADYVGKTICRMYWPINSAQRPSYKLIVILKAFIEVLENIDNYRSHEVDDSNDHLKDAETFVADRGINMKFFKIGRNDMKIVDPRPRVPFPKFYRDVEMFTHPGCYLLDSASIAGLFLQIHYNIPVAEKLKGIEMAEEYIHNKYSLAFKPTRMRINEISQLSFMPVNLTVNLSNFPTFREL